MQNNKTCPWQGGPLLAASIRKLVHNPKRIVAPYLSDGMSAMDIGSGMGFFTMPMSVCVGERGNVIAVDSQPEMLVGLEKKARMLTAGSGNITLHRCDINSLNIGHWNETVDFALVFMMLHEVPDADRLIREVYSVLTVGGKLLFSEPVGHVGKMQFMQSISMIQKTGFEVVLSPKIPLCRSAVFQKMENKS